MKEKIEINKITLRIKEHEIVLSIEELRELQYVIGELIGKDKEYITIPQLPIIPSTPYPIDPYQPMQTWCGSHVPPITNRGGGGDIVYSSANLKVKY